jgi:chromosome segregation ATPase
MSRTYLGLVALGSLAIFVASAADAFAYRGRHHYGYSTGAARARAIASIRGQVAQFDAIARQADAAAAAAQAKVGAANSRISTARETIASSEKEAHQASKDMASAEAELLEAAGPDSEIVQAKEGYDKARAEVQTQEHRVLNSPEYLAKLAKTEGTDEHARVVPQLRAEALENDENYQHAKNMVEVAKHKYMALRNDAVTHDTNWLSASEEKKKALLDQSAALNEGLKGGFQKLPAAQALHSAQRLSRQAKTYASSGRALLGQMGASAPGAPADALPSAK